jgi:Fic family protein
MAEMPRWNVNFDMYLDVLHPQFVSRVAMAHALAGVIRDIPILPSIKDKLDALNILRAVRGTTGIEGVELTEDEVREIMESPRRKSVLSPNRGREEQEVRNAQKVMSYVVKEVTLDPNRPLTEKLICAIHRITTRDIDYPHNIPGKYRSHDVSAGNYLAPLGRDVKRLMREFIQWFNEGAPSRWDPVIRAIVAHFYVISIHPFGDGNGRTSRGVESFLLYQGGVNARSFYSLANYYYKNRQEYVELLDRVRFQTKGDLTPFVLFALKGLVGELQQVHAEVLTNVKSIAFRDYAREQLAFNGKLGSGVGERMSHILVYLSDGEAASLKAIRSGKHPLSQLYNKLTPKTLSRDINFLKQNELIIVDGDGMRANLDIMTRYTPPLESI